MRRTVRERVAVPKWYGIVLHNCPARWSAMESVHNAPPKVAVFCHNPRYIDICGLRACGLAAPATALTARPHRSMASELASSTSPTSRFDSLDLPAAPSYQASDCGSNLDEDADKKV
jgi:hypothetical protein